MSFNNQSESQGCSCGDSESIGVIETMSKLCDGFLNVCRGSAADCGALGTMAEKGED